MLSMTNTDARKQLGFRIDPEELKAFEEYVRLVSERAGMPVTETIVLKALIGFKKVKHVHDEDRKSLFIEEKGQARAGPKAVPAQQRARR